MNKEQLERHRRNALGKGLSALLPSRAVSESSQTIPALPSSLPDNFEAFENIPLEQIIPGPDQPRNVFDQDRLLELAQSIKTNGLLQPITVQKHADGKYRIIAGERRWRAAQIADLTSIPALVRTVEDSHRLELALIENIQREDLNPLEIAAAFERLSTEHGMSHEKIAERTGKDRSTVTNFLRLLRLSEEVKRALNDGHISMGHARALLNISDQTRQEELCRSVIRDHLSVRDTERLVSNNTVSPGQLKVDSGVAEKKLDPNIRAALDEMAVALGTKVHLSKRRLEIEYYSPEDLERIYSVIVKPSAQ